MSGGLTRKCGNYRDVLALSIWAFKSELQTNPMPYHLGVALGRQCAMLMPDRGCAMDWDKTKY